MSTDIRQRPEGALFRTYLSAAGVGPDAIQKPLIGVATAATQVFSEKPDAKELGNATATGIEQIGGGIVVRWDTVRSPEMMAFGHAESYSFAWRDQLADLIESWTRQQTLDGLVLIGDAQETLAGMAMAAARLNIPAVIVTAGSKRWEYVGGETDTRARKINDPFQLLTETLYKKQKGVPLAKTEWFKDCLLAKDNHAANALDLVLEALGVTLPGMATAPAQAAKRHELAFESGQRIISLVKTGYTFRRALTLNSFTNAIRLNAALGGSLDVAVHLMAIAHEAGINLPLDLFDKIARETPQVARLGGVGDKDPHRIEDLDKAGGVWAVLSGFKDTILPSTTVNGKGAMELAKSSVVKDPQVINHKKPQNKQSGIGVLRGNIAPQGAMFLLNQSPKELLTFRGPAAVFESEADATTAVSLGKIKKGTAIVVRGLGPRGGPGIHKLRMLPALLEIKGLNTAVAVLTDGRLPDAPEGLFISLVSPEAAVRGALAILRDGDQIEIDVEKRLIIGRLTDTEMQVRLARWQAPASGGRRGFLERYSRSVSDVHEGAVLK